MKRKCSSQKFIIEIYIFFFLFFFFYVKNFFSYCEPLLSSRIYMPDKKNFQLNEGNFSFVIRSIISSFYKKKKKEKTEPVSVTTPVTSKTIDLAPKPSWKDRLHTARKSFVRRKEGRRDATPRNFIHASRTLDTSCNYPEHL